jgi:polyhydroxybutyrate depolymerase
LPPDAAVRVSIMMRFAIVLAVALVGCHASSYAPDLGAPSLTPPSDAVMLADRPYTAVLPPNYSPAQTWPLVLVLTGAGGDPVATAHWLGFTQLSSARGFFMVAPYPDASILPVGWNPNPFHYPQFDVEYLRAIIHDMEKRYSIDRARVFVVGYSLGAHMAHRMACDDSQDVVGIMALAGQVAQPPPECAPVLPVSVVQVHGTADSVIGYYGDVQNVPPDPSVPSAHQTVAVWGRNDKCTGGIAATGVTLDLDAIIPGSETTVEAYMGCPPFEDVDAGSSSPVGVELWSIKGGTHMPSLTPGFAGLVWDWLTAHARS